MLTRNADLECGPFLFHARFHQPSAGRRVEQATAVSLPPGLKAAALRDLPLAALRPRACLCRRLDRSGASGRRAGPARKRRDIDLVAPGFVRGVPEPMAIGGERRGQIVESRLKIGKGPPVAKEG